MSKTAEAIAECLRCFAALGMPDETRAVVLTLVADIADVASQRDTLRAELAKTRAEIERTEAALGMLGRWIKHLHSTGQVVEATLVFREIKDLGLWRDQPTAGSGEEKNDG